MTPETVAAIIGGLVILVRELDRIIERRARRRQQRRTRHGD